MASRGLLDNTLVAIVADHGENLGEHGFLYRHVGLWDTTTHVPLLIRWPGPTRPGHRYGGLVQTIDLFPTLLAAAHLPVPDQDGIDLRRLSGAAAGRRAVFAEHSNDNGAMVRTHDYQYIVSRGNAAIPDGATLFDLHADPAEIHNLAGRGLPAERQLAGLLDAWLAHRRPRSNSPSSQPQPRPLSPEDAARLRSLGYAGGGT
jgi:arylsulfatase